MTEARSTNPFPNLEGYKNTNLATVRGKRIGPESEARARILGPGEEELVEKTMKRLRRRYRMMPIVDLLGGREGHAILEIESAEA